MKDVLYINAKVLQSIDGFHYRVLEQGAVLAKDGIIDWVGNSVDANTDLIDVIDLRGAWLLPGLIDCHTHLIYAGDRTHEFEMRQHGQSYEAIANAGGGILNTVAATRAASEDELYELACSRLRPYLNQGVTTIEIKSGYGLSIEHELKMLRVAKRIEATHPITVKKTCLAAHALPLEYKDRSDAYIDLIVHELLPKAVEEGLVDFVDVFTETIGFTLEQSRRIFEHAKRLNLGVKCHAEQLSAMGAASLAAEYRALSCDHLEYITAADIEAMKKNNTVAVLLPGAFYYLKEKKSPPIAALREAGIKIAIATDCNPGSSPCNNLLLMLNMACVLWGMTPQEVLRGVTEYAAAALGLQHAVGQIRKGLQADLSVWRLDHPRELAACFSLKQCEARIYKGTYFVNDNEV